MGWAKYFEDNIEINNDRSYYKGLFLEDLPKPVETFEYKCPVSGCNKAFHSKNELFKHIREIHHTIKPIVLINGEIINWGETRYFEYIFNASIVYYCEDPGTITINTNGKKIIDFTATSTVTDLSDDLVNSLNNDEQVVFSFGDESINIRFYSINYLDIGKVSSYIKELDAKAKEGLIVDFYKKEGLNPVEKRCLDGVFNYYIACNTCTNKIDRYEDAYEKLKVFLTTNGYMRFILKVILFRFLWVEKLNVICEGNSLFKYVIDFINNKESSIVQTNDSLDDIYIEAETKNILQAIIDFQKGDYDAAEEFYDKNETNFYNSKDGNYRDLGCLLYTKILLKKNKPKQAQAYYNNIVDTKIKNVRFE